MAKSSEYVLVPVDMVEYRTDKALRLMSDGVYFWVPVSQIDSPDTYPVGTVGCQIPIRKRFAQREGLEMTSVLTTAWRAWTEHGANPHAWRAYFHAMSMLLIALAKLTRSNQKLWIQNEELYAENKRLTEQLGEGASHDA